MTQFIVLFVSAVCFVFIGCAKSQDTPTTQSVTVNDATGGWVSSGGDIFEYSKNPWFVENTALVKYCLSLDSNTFSANEAQVIPVIERSFSYWAKEFAGHNRIVTDLIKNGFAYGKILLATQKFERIPICDGQEDIRFVFGSGALTAAQRSFLKNPRRHVGIAVRQSYDPVHLHGKGFVFIGSDLGEESVFARDIEPPQVANWANPAYLGAILTHEMGHVFGLPHFGSGLMSESFANTLTASILGATMLHFQCQATLSPPKRSYGGLMKIKKAHFQWWGLPDEDTHLLSGWVLSLNHISGEWQEVDKNSFNLEFEVFGYSIKSKDKTPRKLGRIVVAPDNQSKYSNQSMTYSMESLLYLPKEQIVFDETRIMSEKTVRDLLMAVKDKELRESYEKAFGEFLHVKIPKLPLLYGASQFSIGMPATFIDQQGVRKSVFIQGKPGAYTVIAEANGEMVPVLSTGGPDAVALDTYEKCE